VIPHIPLSFQFKLHQHASIFTAEATAIVEAILFLLRTKVQEAIIHSDSRSVPMAIHGTPNKSSSNWHIPVIKSLLRSSRKFGFTYHLSWVKAHSNIHGNELADSCAKSASLSGLPHLSKLPCSDLFPLLKQRRLVYSNNQINELWEGKSSMTRYKSINPTFKLSPWFHFLKKPHSRGFYSTLIRLQIGHYSTPSHLSRLKLSPFPNCPCGQDIGDADHLIFLCLLHETPFRYLFLTDLISLGCLFPTSLLILLSSNNESIYSGLYYFISQSSILI
jgi:hypothetical protein